MLVDDEADLVETLKYRLEASGYEVLTAADGQDGLKKARSEKPNLIILDLMLPKLDGYRVCRMLKFDEKYKNIPIILFSARVQESDIQMGEEQGADAYVTRPIRVTDFYSTIQRLTENRPRKIPRLRVIFKVTILSGKIGRAAFATMISENGVFVRTMNPLKKGTAVKLTLDLPSAKPLALDGEVIYEVRFDRDQFVEPGMGVLFRNIPEEVRQGLKKFIEGHLTGDLGPDMII